MLVESFTDYYPSQEPNDIYKQKTRIFEIVGCVVATQQEEH